VSSLTTALADLAEALDVRGVLIGDASQLVVGEGPVEAAAKHAVRVCRQPRRGGNPLQEREQRGEQRVDAQRVVVAPQRHRSLHGRRERALDQRGDGEGGDDDEGLVSVLGPERVRHVVVKAQGHIWLSGCSSACERCMRTRRFERCMRTRRRRAQTKP